MTAVGRPMHGVDLGQMSLERPPGLHTNTRQGFSLVLRDLTDCWGGGRRNQSQQIETHDQSPVQRRLLSLHCERRGHEVRKGRGKRTSRIGQLILSALDLVLQAFGFAPSRGNLSLHLFAGHVGHLDGTSPWRGKMSIVKRRTGLRGRN